MNSAADAIIVGSGPNGLAAAITLARAGLSVLVVEGNANIGGAARSAPLTLPGFIHDVGSAIHPMALASPFFERLPMAQYGLHWITSPAAVAHPLDDGTAVLLRGTVEETARELGGDAAAYRRLIGPVVTDWPMLRDRVTGKVWKSGNPLAMARFGWRSLRSARALAETCFDGPRARALFAGLGCHSIMPLEAAGSAAVGLVLGVLGHLVGWPLPEGGAGTIINSLAGQLAELGGRVSTGTKVQSLRDLPQARVFVLDLTPRQVVGLSITGQSASRLHAMRRYRNGPGVFKLDWALSSPIPWRSKECLLASTVHIGGGMAEIADYERRVWMAGSGDKPFVMLAQPSLFDATRAPPGKHTAWAYCHVPNGSTLDMTTRIEAQIERFAPGFRDAILARHKSFPADLENDNPNLVGGDIGAGVQGLRRMLLGPFPGHNPYTLVAHKVYLCSAATPPGPGVHGMCGYHAAAECLRNLDLKPA